MFIKNIKSVYKDRLFLITLLSMPVITCLEMFVSMIFDIKSGVIICKADAAIWAYHPFVFSTLIIPFCLVVLIHIKNHTVRLNSVVLYGRKSIIWYKLVGQCAVMCLSIILIISVTAYVFGKLLIKDDMAWQLYSGAYASVTFATTAKYNSFQVFVLSAAVNFVYFFTLSLLGIFILYSTENEWLAVAVTIIAGNINMLTGNTVSILNNCMVTYLSIKRNSFKPVLTIELLIIITVISLGGILFKKKEFLSEKT